jgi:hypothetical protein
MTTIDTPTSRISAAESARRRFTVDEARAANKRQGYVHDPVLEAINEQYVRGQLTREEKSQAIRASIEEFLEGRIKQE